MVVASTWILRRFFFAASMPFLIAAGTSLALPVPKPTIFALGSPTTTSAEKLRFLPPFTTLVTRLIDTTCSFRFRLLDSMRFVNIAMRSLELQSRFAGRVGERLDAPVIEITAAIEHDLRNALFFRPLGNEAADFLRAGDIAAAREARLLFHRRCRGDCVAAPVVDHLGEDMIQTPENRQPRPLLGTPHSPADARVNPHPDVVLRRLRHYFAPAPVFPTFFRSASPVNRTPLFLYGSGGRSARIFAATWPTACLSNPEITKWVCLSTFRSTPSGKRNSIGCE